VPSPRRRSQLVLATLACSIAISAFAAERAAAPAPRRAARAERPPASAPAPDTPGYADRDDVRAFVDEMVDQHGFSRRELLRVLGQARFQARIVAAMQRPIVEPPKWFEYAPNLLGPARVEGGVAFLRSHAEALARAERQYGVPPAIVAAIIGVETFYGRNTGSHRVIDALATLAFDYPRRATFFRGELKEFLLMARAEGISPLVPKGSFAGAIGVPQFMPGSVRRYAVDFDADGHVDLWNSADDAIGSVANYLARHDWARGQPVALPAVIDDAHREAVLARLEGGISERRTLAAWDADGVHASGAPDDLAPEPVGVLLLEEGPLADDASYWIACPNFYVITRYNKSRLYAAAVWRLAEAIRAADQLGR
jgi:membrane-bound lytic murein transglycosylase B